MGDAAVGGEERFGFAHRQGDVEAAIDRVVAAEGEVEGLVPQVLQPHKAGEQVGETGKGFPGFRRGDRAEPGPSQGFADFGQHEFGRRDGRVANRPAHGRCRPRR